MPGDDNGSVGPNSDNALNAPENRATATDKPSDQPPGTAFWNSNVKE